MPQATVSLIGRTYRFECAEGQQARIAELAAYLGAKVEEICRQTGMAGDDRVLAMAGLLIADELFEARELLRMQPASPPADALPPEAAKQLRASLPRKR